MIDIFQNSNFYISIQPNIYIYMCVCVCVCDCLYVYGVCSTRYTAPYRDISTQCDYYSYIPLLAVVSK